MLGLNTPQIQDFDSDSNGQMSLRWPVLQHRVSVLKTSGVQESSSMQ